MITCDKQQWNPDPNDPVLKADNALHEPAAVLRMQRRGWRGMRFAKFLKIDPPESLIPMISQAITDENLAHRRGQASIEDGHYC